MVKKYNPTTPGRRFAAVVETSAVLTRHQQPEKSLLVIRKRQGGRNHSGKITVRHQGGEHKRFFRIIDSRRERFEQPAEVLSLEYDPNRTSHLALVKYADGEKRYIIAPAGLRVGDHIVSSHQKGDIKAGNRYPLWAIPVGIMVHDIELRPATRGVLVRSAGSGAMIQAVEGTVAQLKLPSGEIRIFHKDCMATIGQVSNVEHENIRLGKAGRMRWLGVRPSVRGKAMNPVDHPHGGGEGHNPIGLKHPKTPWGKPALGVKTRKKGKFSDPFIIKRRKG